MKAINSSEDRSFWQKLIDDHGGQKLEAALQDIRQPSQRILRLCYLEHKTFAEIISIVGKSQSVVRGCHSQGML